MAAVYRFWSAVVFVAVVIQVGLAGYGAFYVANKVDDKGIVNEDKFEDGFGIHAGVGFLIVIGGILLLLMALASADRRSRAKLPGILAVLLILQIVLAEIAFNVPAIGFFHPVNALAIFVLSGLIAHGQWRGARSAQAPA